MTVPCVRVPREEGEPARRTLADAGALDPTYDITGDADHLYIPVDPEAVPSGFDVVSRDAPERRTQTPPAELLEFEPSYERLGEVIVVDEDDPDRARQLADALMASDLPVRTVLNRASPVQGDHRVRDWELLAGENTETVHREYGCEYLLDVATVYFSPRLATERHRVAQQVDEGEQAFDMFAGVGPFVIPFAKRGATCVGVDLNPDAIDYLRENARRNGVGERITAIEGDVRDVAGDWTGWADRLVMNLPHRADEFLDTAVSLAGTECVIHYYDIQHDDDPFGPGTAAVKAAAEPAYEVAVQTERVVRSYAPHELNICLDIHLQRR